MEDLWGLLALLLADLPGILLIQELLKVIVICVSFCAHMSLNTLPIFLASMWKVGVEMRACDDAKP
jgi:hypothetical protein